MVHKLGFFPAVFAHAVHGVLPIVIIVIFNVVKSVVKIGKPVAELVRIRGLSLVVAHFDYIQSVNLPHFAPVRTYDTVYIIGFTHSIERHITVFNEYFIENLVHGLRSRNFNVFKNQGFPAGMRKRIITLAARGFGRLFENLYRNRRTSRTERRNINKIIIVFIFGVQRTLLFRKSALCNGGRIVFCYGLVFSGTLIFFHNLVTA